MLGQMVNVTTCRAAAAAARSSRRRASTCRGEGRIERKRTLRVTIPAGIDEGHQIRLSGEGEAGPRGGTPGNLYVVTHVDEHPVLKRDDTELYLELTLSITQAALGTRGADPHAGRRGAARGQARHPAGHRDPPPRQGRAHLRRPGQRGDLHVLVDVEVPTRLSRPRARALEELAAEAGELDSQDAQTGPDGAAAPRRPSGSSRRRKRSIGDRIKDAIG